MTREELRVYVDKQRSLNNIPYHVYSALIDGIDTLEQEFCNDAISRAQAIYVASGYCHPANVARELEKLPSVKPAEIKEPCEDAISRQAVLDIVNNPLNIRLDEIITKLPSVTPQPKIGRWIAPDGDNAICGCCNRLNRLYGTYCKHCGAKMQEVKE